MTKVSREEAVKLLPCPFNCDGKPYRHEPDREIVGAVAIGCDKCGALGPFFDEADYGTEDELWAAAEKAWNTRNV